MPTFPLHTYQAFQASVVQVVFARYDLLGLAPAVKWGTLNAASLEITWARRGQAWKALESAGRIGKSLPA